VATRPRALSRLFLAIVFALAASSSVAGTLQGKVVSVADGDTLTILDANNRQHRIRLAEVDAPETRQPFGNRAKRMLSDLCFGKRAEIRNTSADRYQRVVGTVYCDGVDANAELVRRGMAWVYVQYARRGSPLFALEKEAKSAKLGLWADGQPVPPWEWRRGNRASKPTLQEVSSDGGKARGNRRSNVYHLLHCPSYDAVAPGNRVSFRTEAEATGAGYRRAGNCP